MIKILLPVDGSEAALDAVRHVLQLIAAGLRVNLVLANVQEPASLYEMVLAPDADVLDQVSDSAATHTLEHAEALLKAAGVPYEREIGSGDPAQVLLEIVEALNCDGVVMGARGFGRWGSALMGSVSQSLVHNSLVPVTIVRHIELEPLEDEEA